MAEVQAVLSALEALNQPGNRVAFKNANAWLQDFQHSNEAWATCNVLLLDAQSPMMAKLFAAQTFRTKVVYDLSQLDPSFYPSLRDTLLTALESSNNSPKTIVTQLCLALSGLALQFPEWQDTAVQSMIDKLGQNPTTVSTLLEFLTVLPEEIDSNSRIPVSSDDYRTGSEKLLTANAPQIAKLLTMYIAAQGVTPELQSQIFYCLRNWVIAGEINPIMVAETPLLSFAFEALDSEPLFDAAVDVLCEIIHETQEIDENMSVIQEIVPRLVQIRPKIELAQDDPDQVKGLAKIFSEAGEVYRMLILQHPDTFFPIVEAIGECSAYNDLDVVPVTFVFWQRLAFSIGKKPSVSPLFLEAYRSLMAVMIKHLHYPENPEKMTPQESDDFRGFRHVMGDTLKDCCFVLGSESCLTEVYSALTRILSNGTTGNTVSWQEIEALLFSLRAMGAEIDPTDDNIIPKIMDLMPSLPDHPRVQYTAILMMSRYTPWTGLHPTYIPFQLQFISGGFANPDNEVSAAASQAMVYLCIDCKKDMISYLPQLHSFLKSLDGKLHQDDRMRLYEAVAHVISAMPMEQAAQSLQTFIVDIMGKIREIAGRSHVATKQELTDISDGLENIEVMLRIVDTFGDVLPDSCLSSCREAWSILDALLAKFGSQYDITERTTRVIRGGLRLFNSVALPVVPSVVARMSIQFESTGFASYAWIAGKAVALYGEEDNADIWAAIKDVYERSTSKLASLLQQKEMRDIPDVLEDYLRMILEIFEKRPDIFLESPALPLAIRITDACLTLLHSEVVYAALDIIRGLISHDSLDSSYKNPPPKFPIYSAAIREVLNTEGSQLVRNLLNGLVNDFPEEAVPLVVTIFRLLSVLSPDQLLVWFPEAINSVPMAAAYGPAKQQLLEDYTACLERSEFTKVKGVLMTFHRFCARTKDRRRAVPLDYE